MSHQTCHCGWSKVTTYQGLRIHQGKKGCTPKGVSIPQSQYLKARQDCYDICTPVKDGREDLNMHFQSPHHYIQRATERSSETVQRALHFDNYDLKMSLQTCHCGWSKVTTYHGLRTHQGMKGCMPKGVSIPQNLKARQDCYDICTPVKDGREDLNMHFQSPHHYIQRATERSSETVQRALHFDNYDLKMSLQTCHCGWSKVTTYHGLRTHQGMKGCTPKGVSIPQNQYLKARQDCYDICTPVKDGREDLNAHFQSPHHYVERATERSSESAQRALHFDNYDLAGQRKIEADLRQKVQMRKQKVEEISASLKKCKGDLDREVSEISGVFDEVIRVVKEARREALQPVKKRIHRVEREANDLTQGLQRAIYQLETQAHRPPGEEVDRDWTKVAVDTTTSFGTMRSIMAAMMERIKLELEKLTSIEIQRVPQFAVDVKLDPNTAHARLVLFDKKTQVRDGGESEEVVEAPEGFDVFASVLGMDNVNPDKSYWEVDVGDKTGWDLGIARGDANRKGQLLLNPDNGYWVTVHYDDEHYAAMTLPPTRLALKEKPQKVGVFVDRDEGLVSFYDVTAGSHIYSFTGCSFGGKLYPYLSPHLRQGDNNAEPLAISPVKLDEDEDL